MLVEDLIRSATQLQGNIQSLQTRKSILVEDIKKMRGRMNSIADRKAVHVKAVGVMDRLIQTVASQGVQRIESTVTRGLQLVFGPDLRFHIEKKTMAKGTQYNIQVAQGEVVGDPLTMFGGGVVNVTAFLLRILMLKRFKLAKFMALDESFNNVSEAHIEKVSDMLRHLCDEQGFKMLFVTHQPKFAACATKVYRVAPGPTLKLVDPSLAME